MTLSESIVRQGLAAGLAPPNAAAVLRGQPVAPPPTAAAGFARLVLAGTPQLDARTTDPLPFPESATRQVSHAEERVFRLFETASRPTAPLFGDSAASNSIWDRAQAATDSYYRTGGEDVLLAPPALDVSATDSPSPGAGTVYLDGLDAVASPETAPRYRPSPLSQIRPERNYSPDKSPVCPDPAVAHCPHVELLPESSETVERSFAHMDFMWMPSNIFYSPLYFEDPALERYGHSHGPILQPLASASRFGVQLIGLPYQMALDPPHRRVYPLGFFRPGECAPKQVPNVPLNAEAAAKAGAVYTGLIFAFP